MILALVVWSPLAAQLSFNQSDEYGEPPASHILDRDNYDRSHPESLKKMTESLILLKADYDFDVYFDILLGNIGKDVVTMSSGYHDAWLGDESNGLVFLIDIQSRGGGPSRSTLEVLLSVI